MHCLSRSGTMHGAFFTETARTYSTLLSCCAVRRPARVATEATVASRSWTATRSRSVSEMNYMCVHHDSVWLTAVVVCDPAVVVSINKGLHTANCVAARLH
jgi:hypothetical protein